MRLLLAQRLLLSVLFPLLLVSGCTDGDFVGDEYMSLRDAYDVTIRRDRWGVPHVHGQTDADAAFGLAYAQSEDAWALFEQSLPFYRGENGWYNGVDAAATDYLVHALDLPRLISERYDSDLSEDTRAYVQGFVDGLNYFAATHPELVDERHLPVTTYDVVAGFVLRHLMFYGFDGVAREVLGAEQAKPVSPPGGVAMNGLPVGSNAIAVSPAGSADGQTMLAINSHQPTTGPVAWYEAHISSDDGLNIMGGLFPGSPTISLGFTPDLAWAVTVNRPDLVDVFKLELDEADPTRYRFDGQWVPLEERVVDLYVRIWGWLPWRSSQSVWRSKHGLVLKAEHGAYALRFAGEGEIRQVEQWRRMNRANNFAEWRDAMRMHTFASFNFVYADRESNIFFVHNSLTPERAPGWQWQDYLPGDTSALIWSEYLPFDSLPQVLNPASGYVISANQTPFQVTAPEDNPVRMAPEYGFPTRMTNRAHRGLELLAQLKPITSEDFSAIKHDKRYSESSRAVNYVRRATRLTYEGGTTQATYAKAVDLLKSWNFETDVDNRAAALGVCVLAEEWRAEQGGHSAPDAKPVFEQCVDDLVAHAGRIDPPWGAVNRHVRGDVNVPVGGGPDTLRAVYGRGLTEDGYYTNVAGDGLYYLVEWDKDGNQRVAGIHHFGSATLDEASPHFADQAAPYAREELRTDMLRDPNAEGASIRAYAPGDEL